MALKVIKSDSYKKSYNSKKLQKKHKERIDKIIKLLVEADNFHGLFNNSLAQLYKFERLKHTMNWAFSFRLDNNKIRLIVKPYSINDYSMLKIEEEVLIYDISFEHYKDL